MIYTPLTCRAMRLAYDAHRGQTDRGGLPYVFHPFHLAEQMTDEFSVCAALLHDVVEDAGVPFDALERAFPPEVTRAVRLLTHAPGTDYFDYVRALRSDPIARAVKLADLEHNADESRLCDCAQIDGFGRAARREKDARARAILLGEAE